MDKILRFTLLLDFYEELLTKKQCNAVELYYLNDLSLNEIAETWSVTPQSVQDLLRRTEKILENYEAKLKLIEKYMANKQKFLELMVHIEILEKQIGQNTECVEAVKEMKTRLMELCDI